MQPSASAFLRERFGQPIKEEPIRADTFSSEHHRLRLAVRGKSNLPIRRSHPSTEEPTCEEGLITFKSASDQANFDVGRCLRFWDHQTQYVARARLRKV